MAIIQFVSCCNKTKSFQSLFTMNQFSIALVATHCSHHHEHPAQ